MCHFKWAETHLRTKKTSKKYSKSLKIAQNQFIKRKNKAKADSLEEFRPNFQSHPPNLNRNVAKALLLNSPRRALTNSSIRKKIKN